MTCHHEVDGASNMQGKLLLQVADGEVAVGGLTKHGLPLLGYGGDSHAQQGRGTGIGERHQMLAHLVVVKQDDVACGLLHNDYLKATFKLRGKSSGFS